jgi:hypothetical protein
VSGLKQIDAAIQTFLEKIEAAIQIYMPYMPEIPPELEIWLVFGMISVLAMFIIVMIFAGFFGLPFIKRTESGKSQERFDASAPPVIAEFIGALFVEPKQRAHVLGDRAERFLADAEKFGVRRARRFYWAETLRSLAPFFIEWIKRAGIVGLLWKALTK